MNSTYQAYIRHATRQEVPRFFRPRVCVCEGEVRYLFSDFRQRLTTAADGAEIRGRRDWNRVIFDLP